MTDLTPSMRLKVKRDTFFLPDPNRGVYFRNNLSSFRMVGSTIDKWVEMLIPMFNGEYTLRDLTDSLPEPHRDRVYEIAEALYRNGFVQDVSQDRTHQLEDAILKKYASQIEFLDSFTDSSAYRFQAYRQAKVLAIGSGPFFVSLVSALIESGLPKFHMFITESAPTNRQRLKELIAHARKTDPEIAIEEVNQLKEGMREIVQPFHYILYVSQEGDIEELLALNQICKEEKKMLLPAICIQHVGLAGPLVHPDSKACWESAWRRIHESVFCKDDQLSTYSPTAGAMLANVIAFELFKENTRITKSEQNNQFFQLDLDTMEGNWQSFMPHPLVTEHAVAEWVQDFDLRISQRSSNGEANGLFLFFSRITSKESGIFHIWEEGDLIQLPLSQCRVQTVNPLSDGPAELLPDIVCAGLTHKEARREAGLVGIEAYASQMVDLLVTTLPRHQEVDISVEDIQENVGIGAGETFAEAVCRGLQACLIEELKEQHVEQMNSVTRVELSAVKDDRCQFYLQALTTMNRKPIIGFGEEVSGFPVVWVGTSDGWYGSVGLNITMALKKALQQALMKAQNEAYNPTIHELGGASVHLEEKEPLSIVIPSGEEMTQSELLQTAIQILKRTRKRILIFELVLEPFFKEELAGVFGVLLRKEESR